MYNPIVTKTRVLFRHFKLSRMSSTGNQFNAAGFSCTFPLQNIKFELSEIREKKMFMIVGLHTNYSKVHRPSSGVNDMK